jgi:hypothetical protein
VLKRKYEAVSGDYLAKTSNLTSALDEVLSDPRRTG